jgi:WD40 repeat protein/serine/threonine protein kinase
MSGNKNNQGGTPGPEENSRPEFGDTLDASLFKSSAGGAADLSGSHGEHLPESESSAEHPSVEANGGLGDGTLLPDSAADAEADVEMLDSSATHQYEEEDLAEASGTPYFDDEDVVEIEEEEAEDAADIELVSEDEDKAIEFLKDPSNAPTFVGDSSDGFDDDVEIDEESEAAEFLKDPSNAPTFVGDSSDGFGDDDDIDEESEAAEFLKDPSNAPTFVGDSSDGFGDDDDIDEESEAAEFLKDPSNAPTLVGDSSEDIGEDIEAENDEHAAAFLKDPSNAPTFVGDSSEGFDDDEAEALLKDPSNAPTFLGDSSEGPDDDDILKDPSNAPTFLGDSSAHDKEDFFSQSMGRNENDDDAEGFSADAKASDSKGSGSPRRLSSQVWGTGSRFGLDSSLKIRNRPVTGGGPFGDSPDADYEIVSKLAEGGMGIVYIARQLSLNRQLAIKTLKPMSEKERKKLSNVKMSQVTRHRREMFLSEALVTANLVHPNIVPIHDLCQTADGTPFYSMKQVEGTPWNKVIKTKTIEENLEVLLKVADAVAYAHHNGVINRDLKPENIMLGEFGEVIVLDWGLSVPAPDSGKSKFASPSASIGAGTPAYMAPELWAGPPEKIGRGSDIYLLGAILYEMLAGHPPHAFANPSGHGQATVFQIIDSVLRPNAIVPTQVKGELMDIAMEAMRTRPEDRYQSVQEFQVAIRNFQRHEESRTLTSRADDLVQGKAGTSAESYSDYQTACALYEEAIRGWKGNEKAEEGLFYTQLKYAELAYKRGDFDLGLQMVGSRRAKEFVALRDQLTKAKVRRSRQKTITTASIAAFLIALVGGTIGMSFLYLRAEEQREIALDNEAKAKKSEADAKKQTEIAKQALRETEAANGTRDAAIAREKTAIEREAAANMAAKDADVLAMAAEKKRVEAEKARVDAEMLAQMANKQKEEADKQKEEADIAKMAAEKAATDAAKAAADADKAKLAAVAQQSRTVLETQVAINVRSGTFNQAVDMLKQLKQQPFEDLSEKERAERIKEIDAQIELLNKKDAAKTNTTQTMAVSEDGSMTVWGNVDGTLETRTFDPTTLTISDSANRTKSLGLTSAVSDLRLFESRGSQIAVAACGNGIFLWNTADDSLTRIFDGGALQVVALDIKGDELLAALANESPENNDGGIVCLSLTDGKERWRYSAGTKLKDLAVIPGTSTLIYAGSRGDLSADVVALNFAEGLPKQPLGQLRYTTETLRPPQCLGISPDGAFLVIGNSRDGQILVLPKFVETEAVPSTDATEDRKKRADNFPFMYATELQEQKRVFQYLKHSRPVTSIAFSSSGDNASGNGNITQRMITGSEDRTVAVWSVSGNSDLSLDRADHLVGHGAPITSAIFAGKTNRFVMTAARDNYNRLWDVETYDSRKVVEDFLKLTEKTATTANSDGEYVQPDKSKDRVSILKRRAAELGKAITTGIPGDVSAAEPDATDPRVLKSDTGKEFQGPVISVDLSTDGTVAVTGGIGGTAVMWDSSTGRVVGKDSATANVARFHDRGNLFEEGHKFNMSRLMFLPPENKVLLTSSFDGSLCLWNADPASPQFGTERARLTATRLLNTVASANSGTFLITTIEPEVAQNMLSTSGQLPDVASSQTTETTQVPPGGTQKPWYEFALWNVAEIMSGAAPVPRRMGRFHRDDLTAISISQDDSMIATADRDGQVAVWSTASGELLTSFRGHPRKTYITGLDWLSSESLITAGLDGEIKIWSVRGSESEPQSQRTSAHAFSFRRDKSIIDRMVVSPDRTQVLTIGIDQARGAAGPLLTYNVRLWKIGEAQSVGKIQLAAPALENENGSTTERVITSATWSPDGTRILLVVRDSLKNGQSVIKAESTIQICDLATRKVTEVLAAKSEITDLAQGGEQGNLLATFDGTVAQIWNLADGQHLISCRPQRKVSSLALSRDPAHSVLAMGTDSLLLFNAESGSSFGQTLAKLPRAHSGRISALEFSPVASAFQLASGSEDGSVSIWKWSRENNVLTLESTYSGTGVVEDVEWSADGRTLLAVRAKSGSLIDPTAKTDSPIAIPESMASTTFLCGCLSVSGDAIALAGSNSGSGSTGFVMQRGDDGTFALHSVFEGHGFGGIKALKFIPPNPAATGLADRTPYLISAGDDGAAILWNWRPDRESSGFPATEAYRFIALDPEMTDAHRGAINDIAVTSNGLIVTGSEDGTAVVWPNPLAD